MWWSRWKSMTLLIKKCKICLEESYNVSRWLSVWENRLTFTWSMNLPLILIPNNVSLQLKSLKGHFLWFLVHCVNKLFHRFILHAKKTGFVVEHDFIMATYLADRVIVFEGQASVLTTANSPQSLLAGMNRFLELLGITFRRDPNNFRPRINKDRSVKVCILFGWFFCIIHLGVFRTRSKNERASISSWKNRKLRKMWRENRRKLK